MEKIIQTFSDPANYVNGLIGALLGFLLAPSSIKALVGLIKWYKSKRHWIVGTWHLYYFNFDELKPEFFSELWTIKKTLTGFKVISSAIEDTDKHNTLTFKGQFYEEKNCVLFHLSSNTEGFKDQVFLRFQTGYFKPKKHYMVGVSNTLDWDGEASIHTAVLSLQELTKDQVIEKMNRYIISSEYSIKIHQKQ